MNSFVGQFQFRSAAFEPLNGGRGMRVNIADQFDLFSGLCVNKDLFDLDLRRILNIDLDSFDGLCSETVVCATFVNSGMMTRHSRKSQRLGLHRIAAVGQSFADASPSDCRLGTSLTLARKSHRITLFRQKKPVFRRLFHFGRNCKNVNSILNRNWAFLSRGYFAYHTLADR